MTATTLNAASNFLHRAGSGSNRTLGDTNPDKADCRQGLVVGHTSHYSHLRSLGLVRNQN